MATHAGVLYMHMGNRGETEVTYCRALLVCMRLSQYTKNDLRGCGWSVGDDVWGPLRLLVVFWPQDPLPEADPLSFLSFFSVMGGERWRDLFASCLHFLCGLLMRFPMAGPCLPLDAQVSPTLLLFFFIPVSSLKGIHR